MNDTRTNLRRFFLGLLRKPPQASVGGDGASGASGPSDNIGCPQIAAGVSPTSA